jgi:hypothetical protein
MIIITGKKWFSKTHGNTYHSCMVERIAGDKIETVGYIPFRYGYDNAYLQTAAEILGMGYIELNRDIAKNPNKYRVQVFNVTRRKDL